MHNALLLKGTLLHKSHPKGGGGRQFPKSPFPLSVEKLVSIKKDLESVYKFWENNSILGEKKIVTVYYDRIIAKSNRICGIFKIKNETVIGVKFSEDENPKHIITYGLSLQEISYAINNLEICLSICFDNAWKKIDNDILAAIKEGNIVFDATTISKSTLINCFVDAFYINKIDVAQDVEKNKKDVVITLYDTGVPSRELLKKVGINYLGPRSIDENTFLLKPSDYDLLIKNAPYLIAMSVTDLRELETDDILEDYISNRTIPKPTNEPVIGVIDTQFDESVYFSPWVKYTNEVDPSIKIDYRDYFHGTYVSSIIVDGPALNPDLDDGCGRFRVRHFGVSAQGKFSSYSIMNKIEEVVKKNPDIKVWNLSLGSPEEIKKNFISPEAYVLDKLQAKYDVIFVVAGTNKIPTDTSAPKKIGAPADSINSLVVNSVTKNNIPASYSRNGPVLSFYKKPDVSYYGGDENQHDYINVYGSGGVIPKGGTSFAAPWIARKLGYLIYKMQLSRETAKAMIIDSTVNWEKTVLDKNLVGYGIVPKRIEDIVQTKNDEIKFVINGVTQDYMTYNSKIPVPYDKDYFPFVAKATLCYFTDCSRNQGVDYSDVELELGFGSINDKLSLNKIKNKEDREDSIAVSEEKARNDLRKWDNIKVIREVLAAKKGKKKGKKKSSSDYWGLQIISNERIYKGERTKTKFALVVTLKEVNGKNRFDDFRARCEMSNWFVSDINIETRIDIYNQAEADIEFDE